MFKYCNDNNYITQSNCVLCFDGMMLLKSNFEEELLNKLNALIRNKFNLELTFVVKEMNGGYTDEQLETTQVNKLRSYEEVKEESELHNFKIREPLTYVEIR